MSSPFRGCACPLRRRRPGRARQSPSPDCRACRHERPSSGGGKAGHVQLDGHPDARDQYDLVAPVGSAGLARCPVERHMGTDLTTPRLCDQPWANLRTASYPPSYRGPRRSAKTRIRVNCSRDGWFALDNRTGSGRPCQRPIRGLGGLPLDDRTDSACPCRRPIHGSGCSSRR